MSRCVYLDGDGTFCVKDPELTSGLYFPLANEVGTMSSVTADLGGDLKWDQNRFLLAPVSCENLHNDKSTRNVWLKVNGVDKVKGVKGKTLWSATGRSCGQQGAVFTEGKEETEVIAGFMHHTLKRYSMEQGIGVEITSFVPCHNAKVELTKVTFKNCSKQGMEVEPIVAVPIYGRSADNIRDHRHVTALLHRIETKDYGVVVHPTLTFDERGHQENKIFYGVFAAMNEEKPIGFLPTVEMYIGEGGSFENPRSLREDKIPYIMGGKQIHGYEAMGGIVFQSCNLEAREERSIVFALALGEEASFFEKEVEKYLDTKVFEQCFMETKQYWQKAVNVHYETNQGDFNGWMRWVSFQPMLRRIYGCSFLPHHDYGKGGRGWRDLWQDCLALLIMNPNGVRQMLIDNFGGVRMDGSNATIIGSKQGEFIADRNQISRVWMDHGVWPFLTTQLYIEQTGDLEILLAKQNYFRDSYKEEERQEVESGTVFEHLLVQNLTSFYDVGEHNHIRIRGADWNDALDMAKERGESVAFTSMYGSNLVALAHLLELLDERGNKNVSIAKELLVLLEDKEMDYNRIEEKQKTRVKYIELCKRNVSGEKVEIACSSLSKNLREKGEWIKKHIQETEWMNGSQSTGWYNGYYDNQGKNLEENDSNGPKMMLTSQVFSIMSEVATKEQVKEIIQSADQHLFNKNVGGYRLNTDFQEVKLDMGRMFGFAYGHKENGAVFSHMAVMYANAYQNIWMQKEEECTIT